MLRASPLLGLEFSVVIPNERLDLSRAGKNAKPLFLAEGDGETSHTVVGYGAFLTDLEAQSRSILVFEPGVCYLQKFMLGFHFRFVHAVSPLLLSVSNVSLRISCTKPGGAPAPANSASIRSTSSRLSFAVLDHCSIRSASPENSAEISIHRFSFA